MEEEEQGRERIRIKGRRSLDERSQGNYPSDADTTSANLLVDRYSDTPDGWLLGMA